MSRPSNGNIGDAARRRAQLRGGASPSGGPYTEAEIEEWTRTGKMPARTQPMKPNPPKAIEPRLPVAKPKRQVQPPRGRDDSDLIGQCVVVTILDRHETVMARYYPEGAMVSLRPINSTVPNRYEPRENVRIEARVVAVIRTF